MLYTINTGLLTEICTISLLVLYAVIKHNFVFIGLYFIVGKMYLNALLANLNARSKLRRRCSHEDDIIFDTLPTTQCSDNREGEMDSTVDTIET